MQDNVQTNTSGDHQAICKDCVPMMTPDQAAPMADSLSMADHMAEMVKGINNRAM